MGFFKSLGSKLGLAAINPVAIGASLFSGGMDLIAANQDRKAQQGIANQQHMDRLMDIQMQKEFAQNGIRWRVDDAIAAGLSPLAGIGGSGASYSPVGSVGSGDPGLGASYRALSNMGQNLSRSALAKATIEERAMTKELHDAQVNEMNARADAARAQAADSLDMIRHRGLPPPLPSKYQKMDDGTYLPTHDYVGALMTDPLLMYSTSAINFLDRMRAGVQNRRNQRAGESYGAFVGRGDPFRR